MGTKNNPGRFDCYANAAPDEPMFILLGRDKHAPTLVRLWAILRAAEGEDEAKVAEAHACAKAMEQHQLSLETKPRTVTAPPTRWRNWWRVTQDLGRGADAIEAGSLVQVLRDYPSADVARTHAKEDMDQRFAKRGVIGSYDHCMEYIGAYPEGVRPTNSQQEG
jgi:hypothetical protein